MVTAVPLTRHSRAGGNPENIMRNLNNNLLDTRLRGYDDPSFMSILSIWPIDIVISHYSDNVTILTGQ